MSACNSGGCNIVYATAYVHVGAVNNQNAYYGVIGKVLYSGLPKDYGYYLYPFHEYDNVNECADNDGDGIADMYDTHPYDNDNDGVDDSDDICPNTPIGTLVNSSGCSDLSFGSAPEQICPLEKIAKPGNPITVYNGNKYESVSDIAINSAQQRNFVFNRYYNSLSDFNGTLGYGWTHTYNANLDPNFNTTENKIRIIDETGRGLYFQDQSDGHYIGLFNEKTFVEAENGNFVWYRQDGRKYIFNSSGLLIQIEDKIGNDFTLTYSGGLLQTVTDESTGRTLAFYYNANQKIEYIEGPVTSAISDEIWVEYAYDTNQNLTSVTYADGSGYTYQYNGSHHLTQKEDKSGNILSTWAYDSLGRANSNVNNKGKSVTINYDNYADQDTIVVTDGYGVARTYSIEHPSDGKSRIVGAANGSGCSSCGEGIVRVEYDDNGEVSELEYANGRIDKFQSFDTKGNAQTVITAFGTGSERTIYYTYDTTNHPELKLKLTQREISVLDSGSGTIFKETIWDYDDDYDGTPNEDPTPLLRKIIEKGFTLDSSGSVVPYEYVTTFTYYSNGQVQSIDGPIAGSYDTTGFTYDANGNLLTVTQPVIGTTTYSGYDAAGNPGAVTDVNGVTTSFNTYDGRNRLLSWTRNGITNTRSYNQSGNIGSVTDGTGVSLTFDYYGQAAGISKNGHLWKITDPLGNYLAYDYDTRSNVTDSSSFNASDESRQQSRYD
ncbi:MAG: RHS repeat protein, partial [Desulfobacteraceae bacterium]